MAKKKFISPNNNNREAWLNDIGTMLIPKMEKEAGKKMPPFRISMGFPSRRGLSIKKRVIGECWPGVSSKDGAFEIMISPVLSEALMIVATVTHELAHALVGTEHGHKGPFVHLVRAMGLEGKPTATVPGKAFIDFASPLIKDIGYELPHSPLVPGLGGFKVQKTRLIKCACSKCGYNCRTTKKWIVEHGAPICPTHLVGMYVDPNDLED